MSALNYGLTPKMKPVSPRRSALIAALDHSLREAPLLTSTVRKTPAS